MRTEKRRDNKLVGMIDHIRTFSWKKKLETPTVINQDLYETCMECYEHSSLLSIQIHNVLIVVLI